MGSAASRGGQPRGPRGGGGGKGRGHRHAVNAGSRLLQQARALLSQWLTLHLFIDASDLSRSTLQGQGMSYRVPHLLLLGQQPRGLPRLLLAALLARAMA